MVRVTRMLAVVAVLALALAACGGGNGDGDGGDGGAGAAEVSVTGLDRLAFEPSSLTAPAGEISVELTAESGVNHTFVVETPDGDVTVAAADAGATDTGAITLEAGTYTFYCDVDAHREAGMEGTLTVE